MAVRRIKLIVTGDLEHRALHLALQRAFPQNGAGAEVKFETPRKISSFTSAKLAALPPDARFELTSKGKKQPVVLMAEALLVEAQNCDLAVAIDDLELANQDQPSIVIDLLRRAVQQTILDKKLTPSEESRIREQARKVCSFHLLDPMIEAYFYGDVASLYGKDRPLVQPTRPQLVDPNVENFETDDPTFLPLATEKNNAMSSEGYPWWRHERHPKYYLEHLAARSGNSYDEVTEGKAILGGLDWPSVPEGPASVPFLRSLFQDLADALGVPNPLPFGNEHPLTYPGKKKPAALILRNL